MTDFFNAKCSICEKADGGVPGGKCPLILDFPGIPLDQKISMAYFTSLIGCKSCIPATPKTEELTGDEFTHLIIKLNDCHCDTCKEISRKLCEMRIKIVMSESENK